MEMATGQAPWVAYIQVSEKAVWKKNVYQCDLTSHKDSVFNPPRWGKTKRRAQE